MEKSSTTIKETIGIGRRKTAVSSVRLRKGNGIIDINGSALKDYFPSELQRNTVLSALIKFANPESYDLVIRVKGGGKEAQAIATRLGISRALVQEDEGLRPDLKALGYLTRDPRKREREKYGRAGARKRFQFSKR